MSEKQKYDGFSEEERTAMKQRAAELKTASKPTSKKAATERQALLDTIAAMPGNEAAIANRVHEIVTEHASDLLPKTWYGMPAWARDGKVVVFVKHASKFKMRYTEVGFTEDAHLDSGDIWATVFAVTTMTPTVDEELTRLVRSIG
ncbi:hypothetical protein ncot_11155 [Nocardioides sp. JQ2195]|uniref:hypothetical protein n=1 Tax=Nocardioides sp. JQ2195 TaxID=2592334 RepID=UPI00143E5C70|nr:hypothetical protein [Nocardioides sp. JQ2195]QIX27090.1 hypothetical protein ncot_11155 [Nocardioides sp. JQ2195]